MSQETTRTSSTAPVGLGGGSRHRHVGTTFTLFVVPVLYSLIVAQHQPTQPRLTPDEGEPEELALAAARA